ncbi:MAG TPA: glycosyltransferase family 39 protein, partial [Polyangium sp.]|nr:glycosyltransferase family 39 protein [Polyangium sp.]
MNEARRRRDSGIVVATALAVRIAVVLWAASRFPPTADGTFYHRIAERMAQGHGYTWLWPDGVVTYAGHYPVGYPALVAAGYALFGAHPGVAMILNALLGSLAALAVHRLSCRMSSPRLALVAGLVVALHPALVTYTPALMSEGVTASLVTCAAWVTASVRDAALTGSLRSAWKWLVLLGFVIGLATLVRPQSIVFAPLFALVGVQPWITKAFWKRAVVSVGVATISTFLLLAPWTARNCARMGRCALVSYNGGWNL